MYGLGNRLHNTYIAFSIVGDLACMLVSCLHIGVMLHPTPICKTNCPGKDVTIAGASLLSFMGFGNAVSNIVTYNHDVSSSGQWIIGSILYITIPVSCGQPVIPGNGSIETYQNTTEGAEIFFRCNPGFVPAGTMRATCGTDGRWTPDPATLVCTGEIS